MQGRASPSENTGFAMETSLCYDSSPVLIRGGIRDKAPGLETMNSREAPILFCTSLGRAWSNSLLGWPCSPFGRAVMERGTRRREGSAAESSAFCLVLNWSFSSLLFLSCIILLFQSFQMGMCRNISHSVLKRQHAYKTRIYVVKSLRSVGFVLLFYFLPGDRALQGPASRLLGTTVLRSGPWVRMKSRTVLEGTCLSFSDISVTGRMFSRGAVQ